MLHRRDPEFLTCDCNNGISNNPLYVCVLLPI